MRHLSLLLISVVLFACSPGTLNGPRSDGRTDHPWLQGDGQTNTEAGRLIGEAGTLDRQVSSPDLVPRTSITKDGITWTFSKAVPVGQFVTGDYYAVGPVTVASISPPPQSAAPFMNGSVLNLPTADGKSGFDQRLNDGVDQSGWFNASHRVYPPISLSPGDVLVSSISVTTTHSLPQQFGSTGDMNSSPVRSVSILTVLSAAPGPDAFRPSYCDRTQTLLSAGKLKRDLLPSRASPNQTIASGRAALLAQLEAWLRRPWIDTSRFLFDVPGEYMPSYSQQVALVVGYSALLLCLDFPAAEKVNLTNYLVQYGIDLFGCAKAGYGWGAFGGHGSGRKLPILLAGLLLGEVGMTAVSASYPDRFGEDMQTIYVTQVPPAGTYQTTWQGASYSKAIYGGHLGVTRSGKVDSTSFDGAAGPYEHLPPGQWPTYQGSLLGENYRRCCTSNAFIGEALAARLLGAVAVWDHQAFFDYADRWMTEDDSAAVAAIKAQAGADYSTDWQRQRQTRHFLIGRVSLPTLVDDLWAAYR